MNGIEIFKNYFENPEDCKIEYGGFCELHTYHIPLLEKPMSSEDTQIVKDIGWELDLADRWYKEEWN